jgi:hypothetical protein
MEIIAICNSDYGNGVPDLPGVANDAILWRERGATVYENCDHDYMLEIMSDACEPDTMFVYCGHGFRMTSPTGDVIAGLVPIGYGSNKKLVTKQALQSRLEGCALVVLDCCYAQAMTRSLNATARGVSLSFNPSAVDTAGQSLIEEKCRSTTDSVGSDTDSCTHWLLGADDHNLAWELDVAGRRHGLLTATLELVRQSALCNWDVARRVASGISTDYCPMNLVGNDRALARLMQFNVL